MVSPAMLIVALVIAIAIILFCIIVLKLNASCLLYTSPSPRD